jgi:alpha-D-xyloside xylohydrolase
VNSTTDIGFRQLTLCKGFGGKGSLAGGGGGNFSDRHYCGARQFISMTVRPWLIHASLVLFIIAWSPLAQGQMTRLPDGIQLSVADGLLSVRLRASDVVHVSFANKSGFFDRRSLSVVGDQSPPPAWTLRQSPDELILATAELAVRVDRASGRIAFCDPDGHTILAEAAGARELSPADVSGEKTFHVRQQWESADDESLFGLGENQLGLVDIKGHDIELWQHNGTIALPFLLSSRGWGVFWDNTSYTRFGDLRPFEPIPADCLSGGLNATHYSDAHFRRPTTRAVENTIDLATRRGGSATWEGTITPPVSGDYQFQTFSNGGISVWLDGRLVINHWRQNWLPWLDVARINMQSGRKYTLKVAWWQDQSGGTVRLLWKTPVASTNISLWSEVGEGIDYYFFRGPKLDKIVAGYRQLTGQAPMMPQWAFGLWQSRQRYKTAKESLDVVEGFRQRGIPFDNIVQDWQYWKPDSWGSHQFDPSRFPDPLAWIKSIHDQHAHVMISIWGKFYPGNANFQAMHDAGFLYERNLREGTRDWLNYPYTFFDAFNPGARKLFWQQINNDLFSKGVDAWWMDASEPDLRPEPTLDGQRQYMNPTALGSGSRMLNAYPLMTSQALYEGQRLAAPDQRVFILTRSGFAGQQRYAAAVWSGDSTSTWTAMAKQVAAGVSMSVSGLPFWSMDVGGFSVPTRFAARRPTPADVGEWRELNARWFEFGAFCPLLRVHGEFPNREMWEMGGEASPAYRAELKFDRLRYSLLPYIYSVSADVTQNGGTMMRPLVMDFPDDAVARRLNDEYLFGPAFLVSPVTEFKARQRTVRLPAGAAWFDFWTGDRQEGGQTINADAPLDEMPLFVRAGSIVPFGPAVQYVGEKPADPITLDVYAGADGDFSLYEDEGTNYNYERGAFSRINMHWNDAAGVLTLGPRVGTFPGMLEQRTFNIVFHPSGQANVTVHYDGQAVQVSRESK